MTRRGWTIATTSAASLFAVSFTAVAVFDPLPRVIWNASASAPIGLYRIEPDHDPAVDALVAVTPPAPLARWLAERGYLGERVPLLKHVAAKPGQLVCRIGAVLSVDGRPIVVARERDGRGRPLPVWRGCRMLRAGELLMLNPDHADSMDGRYFGSLPASSVLGRAIPILTRDTPDAPLDVFDMIGAIPIADLTPPLIPAVLREIEARGAIETAKRVRQRILGVFVYAIAKGITQTDPAEKLGAVLNPLRKGRQPAITDLVPLRKMILAAEGDPARPVTRLALRLLALTAVRPGCITIIRVYLCIDLRGRSAGC